MLADAAMYSMTFSNKLFEWHWTLGPLLSRLTRVAAMLAKPALYQLLLDDDEGTSRQQHGALIRMLSALTWVSSLQSTLGRLLEQDRWNLLRQVSN